MNHAILFSRLDESAEPPTAMPVTVAIASLPVLATLLSIPVVAVVVKNPESADAWSVVGAIFAAVITLIDARKKDKDLGLTVSAFMGSSITGALAPGIVYTWGVWRGWWTHELAERLTWHAWAGAGFVAGLHGWAFVHLMQALGQKIMNFYIRKRLEQVFRLPADTTKIDEP